MDDEPVRLLPTSVLRLDRQPEDGFRCFYRDELLRLVRFLMKAGATRTEAEDAAQEAMIQAWRCWNELTEPENNPRGWVRKVAMRVFLKTVPKRLSCGEALPVAVDEVVVDLSERTQLVLRLFALLPYMSRMVLAYTADGFTDEETAAELNTTPAAVRKSRQRGRQTMKELLRGGEL